MRASFISIGKMQTLCILYLSIWVTAPILAYGSIYRVLAFFAMAAWILLEVFDSNGIIRKPSLRVILIFFFVLYTTSVVVLSDGAGAITRNIQLYVFLFFIIIHDSYRNKGFEKLKIAFNFSLILMPIWLTQTYLALQANSRVARILVRSSEQAVELSNSGVGGFGLVYFVLAYSVCLLGLLKLNVINIRKNKFFTLLIVINIIFSLMVIYKSQYSTALITLLIAALLVLFLKKVNLLYLTCFSLFSIVMIVNLESILVSVADFFIGTNYHLKIMDIIYSLRGNEAGTVDDRTARYLRSIILFVENPVIGSLSLKDVGKHSLILDNFAQFGIFFGCMLSYIIFSIPYEIFKKEKNLITLTVPIFFVVISLTLLNNIAMSFGYVFFVFYPYLIYRIKND
jgi:hypothetical protein